MGVIYGVASGPRITNVYVGSLSGGSGIPWSGVYLNYLSSGNLGSSTYGYEIPVGTIVNTTANRTSNGQLNALSWINLNSISIRFNQNVSIPSGNLSIVGVTGVYNITGFSYNSGDRTASWFFNQTNRPDISGIRADKIRVTLSASGLNSTTLGLPLAGGITNATWTTTGDSTTAAGTTLPSRGSNNSDFSLRLNLLPGGPSTDTAVNVIDQQIVNTRQNATTSSGNYLFYVDVNGDGIINGSSSVFGTDAWWVAQKLLTTLPTGNI